MKYYTETISATLAEKLKEKGMPMITSVSISIVEDKPVVDENGEQWYRPMFCVIFDWMMKKGYAITVYGCGSGYHWLIDKECDNPTRGTHITQSMCGDGPNDGGCWDTWHEAATKAIEKALTLI